MFVLTKASLLGPAFEEVGPQSCVGLKRHWASYSWPPAIMFVSLVGSFILHFGFHHSVESKRGWVYFFRISCGSKGLRSIGNAN